MSATTGLRLLFKTSTQLARRRIVQYGLLVLIAPYAAVSAAAQDAAQTAGSDVPFGIIEILPERLVPHAAPDDPRSADALFDAAMAEMQSERFDEARRLLELFVVRDPGHPSVPEARKHLSELYQSGIQAAPAGVAIETAATPEPVRPAPSAARIVATPRSVGGRLEENFMLEAGDRVFFAPGSAELGSRARLVLAAQARWLQRNGSLSAVIEGHADDPALDHDRLDRLAAERAQTVFLRLIEEGVAPDRLAIAPQGNKRPVATCTTPDCSAQNRRAVTVLTVQRVTELPVSDPLVGPKRP